MERRLFNCPFKKMRLHRSVSVEGSHFMALESMRYQSFCPLEQVVSHHGKSD